jgi:iron complex transport system permease protein
MKTIITPIVIISLFLLAIIVSSLVGATNFSISDFSSIIFSDSTDSTIFWQLRFPRIVAAIAVGASLAVSGVVMQSSFANPLVEPYTLGLSGASSLGIALVYILKIPEKLGSWSIPLGAFLGAIPITVFLLLFGNRFKFKSRTILLSGVMLSYITGSAVTLILS